MIKIVAFVYDLFLAIVLTVNLELEYVFLFFQWQDFKSHIEYAQVDGQPVIEKMVLDQILGYLPQLQMFNEELLTDVKARIDNW